MFWNKKEQAVPEPTRDEHPGEVEKVVKIKNLCWIAKVHAEAYVEMSEEQRSDKLFGQYKYARYRKFMSEAISLARELRDEFYRDAALHQLIDLLMVAKEENLAKDLFKVIEVDVIQDAILKDHPQLAAKF
jgi:homoserine trans-succinylase